MADDVLVLLDENGRQFSSDEFSKFITQRQNTSVKRLVFLIGGPFGFDEFIYKRAQFRFPYQKWLFAPNGKALFCGATLPGIHYTEGEKYHHIWTLKPQLVLFGLCKPCGLMEKLIQIVSLPAKAILATERLSPDASFSASRAASIVALW